MKDAFFILAIFCQFISFPISGQTTWTKTSLQEQYPVSNILSLGKDLMVSTMGGGIYKSINNGDNWSEIKSGLSKSVIFSLINNSKTLYAAAYGDGIYKSVNEGESWEFISSTPDPYIYSLAVSGKNLIAGTWSGIYYSQDGLEWIKAEIKGDKKHSIAFTFRTHKNKIYAGSGRYIFVSEDHGISWRSQEAFTVFDIQAFFENKDTLLAGSSGDGILASVDGELWQKKLPNKSETELKNVTSLVSDSTGLLVASANTNILNQGDKMVYGKSDLRAKVVHYHKGKYYAGTYGGGLWRLDTNKKISELEVRNSLELFTALYPNPAFKNSVLEYSFNQAVQIKIDIIHPEGKIYRQLNLGMQGAGQYQLKISDLNLGSGIYYLRLQADQELKVLRLVIIN
ncbi:MAG TPA: T9SS type A sorting domain-containing protein [Saprospiraceae bacterium]|nr:T9SS type A sorting domain-containing protein [Saprospiraceae bacterium]HNT22315.1 T9SS type A sorting domain-containing protein [Saprospiraceae bacterium]